MISIYFDLNHFFEMHYLIISVHVSAKWVSNRCYLETLNEIEMFKSDVQSKVAHEIFKEN